jgi:1-acyl-sn-glycerol-3-phosphate acyltransferase
MNDRWSRSIAEPEGYQNGPSLSRPQPTFTGLEFHSIRIYDIVLRTARFIDRGKAVPLVDLLCDKTVGRIFAFLHVYCGVRFEYENRVEEPLPERFLLISNHQSLLDIPVIMGLLPGRRLRFVAKTELGTGIPFISPVLKTQGHALVMRSGDFAQSMGALGRFARRCRRDGTCPVVFPEGTRSKDGRLGVFNTAGVRKVLETGSLPIVVAAIDGGWRISTFKDLFSDFRGLRYRFRISGILPAPSGKKGTLGAIAAARSLIEAQLAEMRAESG